MTKPVPAPPLVTKTSTTFGSCDGSHDPLFAVRPGVSAEDALVHATIPLKSAYRTNAHACDMVDAEVREVSCLAGSGRRCGHSRGSSRSVTQPLLPTPYYLLAIA